MLQYLTENKPKLEKKWPFFTSNKFSLVSHLTHLYLQLYSQLICQCEWALHFRAQGRHWCSMCDVTCFLKDLDLPPSTVSLAVWSQEILFLAAACSLGEAEEGQASGSHGGWLGLAEIPIKISIKAEIVKEIGLHILTVNKFHKRTKTITVFAHLSILSDFLHPVCRSQL